MTKLGQITSPVETARPHLVSKDDVGHGAASAARNDGYARRTKLRTAKSAGGSGRRKADTGEVSGDDDSAGEEEDQEQTDSDADITEDEDVEEYTTAGASLLSRQNSNASGLTDVSSLNDQPGFQLASSSMKRKRTTSDLSATTVLSTIERDDVDDDPEVEYPRKRMSRRLSNENGLLRYDQRIIEVDEDIDVAEYSKAIESSSEDELALPESSSEKEDDDDDDSGDLDDSFVEEEEEALIIEEENARLGYGTAASSVVGAESDIEIPSDLDLGFFNSEMDNVFNAGESFFFHGLDSDQDDQGTPRRKRSDASARRVRFQDEIDIAQHKTYSSSTISSETDIDVFPDLLDNSTPFRSQEDLPANLRSQIEDDEDGEVGHGASSDGEGSVWDFGEEKASENFFAWHDEAGSDSDDDNGSGSDLSGYDCMGCPTCTFIFVMLTFVFQLTVIPPMMTFHHPALLERHGLYCTAALHLLLPLNFPLLNHSLEVGAHVVDL
jgi:hypothetical protein